MHGMQEVDGSIPSGSTIYFEPPDDAVTQLWAPWRMAYVGGDEPAPDGCPLCLVGAGSTEQSRHVVARTNQTFTVLNRYPYSVGHVMVVPNRHIAGLDELNPAESTALLGDATRAVEALKLAMRPQGFNLGINCGPAAGSSIDHLHLHVVPRWAGDTNFMPVLADVKVMPEHLDATAEKLRQAYSQLP